jgi:hypothetical protein
MATNRDVPSIGAALSALARLTLVRLLRGKLLWVSVAIAFLPIALAKAVAAQPETALTTTFGIELFVLAILPPLFAAPAIGEELEDRTATYLWSRPLPRWSILAGKLLALAPFVMAILVGSWIASIAFALHTAPPPLTIVALAAGTLAVSVVSAGIATLAPKRGMAFAIIYILDPMAPRDARNPGPRRFRIRVVARLRCDRDGRHLGPLACSGISPHWPDRDVAQYFARA